MITWFFFWFFDFLLIFVIFLIFWFFLDFFFDFSKWCTGFFRVIYPSVRTSNSVTCRCLCGLNPHGTTLFPRLSISRRSILIDRDWKLSWTWDINQRNFALYKPLDLNCSFWIAFCDCLSKMDLIANSFIAVLKNTLSLQYQMSLVAIFVSLYIFYLLQNSDFFTNCLLYVLLNVIDSN